MKATAKGSGGGAARHISGRSDHATALTAGPGPKRCAVYVRKSTEEGLDQAYNSLDAQRDAGNAHILSMKHEGWQAVTDDYVDPAYSGGNMERPGLKRLLADIERGKIDVVIVYKIDRLTRSLLDFGRMMEVFDRHGTAFVSVTQSFNTGTAVGRMTLNMLLTFAQFEREVTGERIRDKLAAAKKKGLWMGGVPPLGYDVHEHHLVVNETEAALVRRIFTEFAKLASVSKLVRVLEAEGVTSKAWTSQTGKVHLGQKINAPLIYKLIRNRIFLGEMRHRDQWFPGEHQAIITPDLWEQAQAVLAVDSHARANVSRAKVPFLLRGLLFDRDGRALQPWQSRKKSGRLYRYYLSTREFKEYPGASGLPRLPAEHVEGLVLAQVRELIRTPSLIAAIAQQAARLDPSLDEAQVTVALRYFDQVWEQLSPDEQQQAVRLLIEKIIVSNEALEIRLHATGAASLGRELRAHLAAKPTKERACV